MVDGLPMSVPRILMLVFGILFTLLALGFLFSSGAVLWLNGAHSSGDGYVSTHPVSVSQDSYAVISKLSINSRAEKALGALRQVNIRLECENADPERAIFLGIAEEEDVRKYLDQVDYDQVLEMSFYPMELRLQRHLGEASPAPPGSQNFWKAAAWGKGAQSVDLHLQAGDYLVVVMNADASRNMDFYARLEARVFWVLLAVGVILFIFGMAGLAGSLAMVYFALRGE